MVSEETTSNLLPVYLIVGEDELKQRIVIERLRKTVAQHGDFEFNHDELSAENVSGDAIVDACNTLPFASDLRLVEVRAAHNLAKVDSEKIISYLEHPNETTVLALLALKLAKNTRLYQAVSALGKKAVIDCTPMKHFDLIRALQSMSKNYGFVLTVDASEKLVELVGEDTVALDSELRKLALAHAGHDPVTNKEVVSLVARVTEAKPWELVDAFSARDVKQCAILLPLLKKTSPYALIGMCAVRLRELICAKSLATRGEANRLAEELKVPPWRVKKHRTWSALFTESELKHAFSTARDCERAMKSGFDPNETFRQWLFNTINRPLSK